MNHEVKLVVSPAGEKVLDLECGVDLTGPVVDKRLKLAGALGASNVADRLEVFDHKNVAAPISSGSFAAAGMVIVPCSMGTVGRIANGVSSDLISRAADVSLKERRKLIVVPRETPLSEIHIRNMLTLTQAGGIVLPAMPAFYHQPKTIADMVDMVVSRILDHLGVANDIFGRWQGDVISEIIAMDEE
jgi:4-hydroxy-3-polyprenylbenzoate decarboxylase